MRRKRGRSCPEFGFWEGGIALIQFLQIRLQLDAVDEGLFWGKKERNNLHMEIVLRGEDRAKRQVIEIGQIDVVAGLDVSEQLRRQDQAEEKIDGKHEDEIGHALTQRWAPFSNPVRYGLLFQVR